MHTVRWTKRLRRPQISVEAGGRRLVFDVYADPPRTEHKGVDLTDAEVDQLVASGYEVEDEAKARAPHKKTAAPVVKDEEVQA